MLAITNIILLKEARNFDIKSTQIFIFIVISSLLTLLINRDSLFNYVIFLIFTFVSFIIANSMEWKIFLSNYLKVMYFLAAFSLISFFLIVFIATIPNSFPTFSNSEGVVVNNLLFSVTRYSTYLNRNYGMFWEPGA